MSSGSVGSRLSVLGMGCARIGSFNNTAPSGETRRLLERALDLGINVFDTADVYGQGDSERTIGAFLHNRRQRAFVISKVGLRFSPGMRLLSPVKPIVKAVVGWTGASGMVTRRRSAEIATDFTPRYVSRAVNASLKRLRFDHIDALLLHSPAASDLVDPALAAALLAIKESGKARHIGISCDDMASLRAAVRLPGVTVLEVPQAVLRLPGAAELLAAGPGARRHVFAREVIRMQPALRPVEAVKATLRNDAVDCVIVGTTRITHLEELAGEIMDTTR